MDSDRLDNALLVGFAIRRISDVVVDGKGVGIPAVDTSAIEDEDVPSVGFATPRRFAIPRGFAVPRVSVVDGEGAGIPPGAASTVHGET